jgi:hypothetical protein
MRRISFGLVVASLALACNSDRTPTSPLPTPPTPTAPTPVSPGFSFTGTVYEVTGASRQAITGVNVGLRNTIGNSNTFFQKSGSVDARGRFNISGLGAGRAAVWANKDGYVQPCAVTLTITGDTERDIEIVPSSAVEQTTIARLQDYRTAILTGTVFAVTGGIRTLMASASIGIEIDMDYVNASTRTDASGRYTLCGLPPEVAALYLAAPGAERLRGPWKSLGTIDFGLPENRQMVRKDFEIEVP